MITQRDDFTGFSIAYQRARLDEAFLRDDDRFDLAAYNRTRNEQIDIGNPNSMAAIYGYAPAYFRNEVLPQLDFVRRERPLYLSCVSSLSAHACEYVGRARAAQSEAGRSVGVNNLTTWGIVRKR
jgi:hypothetical protein